MFTNKTANYFEFAQGTNELYVLIIVMVGGFTDFFSFDQFEYE